LAMRCAATFMNMAAMRIAWSAQRIAMARWRSAPRPSCSASRHHVPEHGYVLNMVAQRIANPRAAQRGRVPKTSIARMAAGDLMMPESSSR
jgi:hypothetical protein